MSWLWDERSCLETLLVPYLFFCCYSLMLKHQVWQYLPLTETLGEIAKLSVFCNRYIEFHQIFVVDFPSFLSLEEVCKTKTLYFCCLWKIRLRNTLLPVVQQLQSGLAEAVLHFLFNRRLPLCERKWPA